MLTNISWTFEKDYARYFLLWNEKHTNVILIVNFLGPLQQSLFLKTLWKKLGFLLKVLLSKCLAYSVVSLVSIKILKRKTFSKVKLT